MHYAGKCPVCRVGIMEIYYNVSEPKCFAMCDECSVEFNSADELKNCNNGKRVFYDDVSEVPEIRAAKYDELIKDGWNDVTDQFFIK